MAFNLSSMSSELIDAVGSFTNIEVGMTTMASGTGTATARHLIKLHGIVGCVQGATGVAETVICTATSGNTATLETISEVGAADGTSVVMWLAWGVANR